MATAAVSCGTAKKSLETVPQLDINKYAGTWYEIARLPNGFEKRLDCVSATYTPLPNGKIEVYNEGYLIKDHNKLKQIRGSARVPDAAYPARLKVTFFWPFSGDYWVMALDKDYRYALVGDPSRKYLWILSREKDLDKNIYQNLSAIAAQKGFDTSKLIRVNQQI